ncbi:MAG: flagellar hook-length control protein FliK [Halioglobus sp.]
MNEVKVALASQLVEQRQLGQLLKSWQVGQVLQGRVIDTQPNGRLLLGVGGQQLLATSEVPVARGAVLSLQVSSLFPLPTLRVQNLPLQSPLLGAGNGVQHSPVPLNPNLRGHQQSQQHYKDQLQLLLPRQGSVSAPLVDLFNPAVKVNILSVLGVKTDVLERLNKSFSQLGLLTDLKNLQQSVARSGLFLEASLAHSLMSGTRPDSSLGQHDLKAVLLRLQQQLHDVTHRLPPGALPEPEKEALIMLHSQLEGALAAITLNQLAVTASETRPGGIWLFDMPFLVRESLRDLSLTIEKGKRETAQADDEDQEWRATVKVSLPALGPIEGEFFLQGHKVSIAIYAQLIEGANFLEARLGMLDTALTQHGLDVSVLRVHHGTRDSHSAESRWQPGVDITI